VLALASSRASRWASRRRLDGTVVDVASDVSDGSVGRRIAKYRKLRGLTQRGLAMRANVAYGTLTKIESGHALAPPAVIAALARALSVNVADLTGQPFMDELRQERVDRLIEPLRLALDRFDLPPPEDVEPRSTAEVDRATTDLCDRAIRDGLVAKAAAELPGLLDELAVIIAATDDQRAWRALASAYRCVRHVVLNWGFRDLADIALDRATWAGTKGGDPLAEAVRHRARASNHLRAGSYESGRHLLSAAIRAVEDAPPGPRRDVLVGHTHLGWAVNAARSGDEAAVQEHLGLAEEIARRTGEAPTLGWFGFGPTNVAVHRVATLIEGGHYGRAIEASASLHVPSGLACDACRPPLHGPRSGVCGAQPPRAGTERAERGQAACSATDKVPSDDQAGRGAPAGDASERSGAVGSLRPVGGSVATFWTTESSPRRSPSPWRRDQAS
jgi:transcriptional regulator with XRE-family HTH domain